MKKINDECIKEGFYVEVCVMFVYIYFLCKLFVVGCVFFCNGDKKFLCRFLRKDLN